MSDTKDLSSETPIIHSTRNPQISQDLFRFAHIVSPEGTGRTDGFPGGKIKHPDPDSSHFISGSGSTLQKDAENKSDDFVALHTLTELKSINPDLYRFSGWLKRNRGYLPYDEVLVSLGSTTILEEEKEIKVWDNLFFQAINQSSKLIREALLSLLKANNWIKVFQTFSKNEYTDEIRVRMEELVNAPVIIPGKIFGKPSEITANSLIDDYGTSTLLRIHEAALKTSEILSLQNTLEEVNALGKAYSKKYWGAYNLEYGKHEENFEDLEAGKKRLFQKRITELDFTPPNPFEAGFLKTNLSQDSLVIFEKVKKNFHESIPDVEEAIAEKINQLKDEIDHPLFKIREEVHINGTTLISSSFPSQDRIILQRYKSQINDKHSIFLSLFVRQPDQWVINASVKISSQGKVMDQSQSSPLQRASHIQTFQLFPDGLILPDKAGSLSAKITLSFSNGSQKTIATPENWNPDAPLIMELGNTTQLTDGGSMGVNSDLSDPHLIGVKKVGVSLFKRVSQELCCYVEGEVSHIENILAREYKERSTRNLTRTEITTEETFEREAEKQTDTTTTDRYEMQNEVSNVINEDKSMSYGSSANVSYGAPSGPYNISLSGTLNGSNSSSTSNSFNQAENFAKEVTERALERVVQRVSKTRTSRMLREFEENNRHGFDNRKGDKHVVGIYRWVDKLYKNKLINYGKRLVYEFRIPEPARNFIHLMTQKPKEELMGAAPVPPKKPTDFYPALSSSSVISRNNYSKYAKEYDAIVEPPPVSEMWISESFHAEIYPQGEGDKKKDEEWVLAAKSFNMEIPDGYFTTRLKITMGAENFDRDFHRCFVSVSTKTWEIGSAMHVKGRMDIDWHEKNLPITFSSINVGAFRLNVQTKCVLKHEVYKDWQNQTYLAIQNAYHQRLADYKDAKAQYDAERAARNNDDQSTNDFNFNPQSNRATEKRELKRLAMDLMTRPFGIRIGENHYHKDNCGYQVHQSSRLDRQAELAEFLEEAFDWEIMAYLFYPYYWSSKCDWGNLLNTTSDSDPIFQAFLQSGLAKAVVPVRPGYEKPVMFFMDTGTIWSQNSNITLEELEDLYDEIDRQLEFKEETVEATWSSKVPTGLTILQTNSGPLQANGLPCFNPNDPYLEYCEDGTPIATGDNLLNGETDPCEDLDVEYRAIIQTVSDEIEKFNVNGKSVCIEVLTELKKSVMALQSLKDRFLAQGCNPSDLYQELQKLAVSIQKIKDDCANG